MVIQVLLGRGVHCKDEMSENTDHLKCSKRILLEMHRKTLEIELELHSCSDVPSYSLSAKIRCCHLRNNILSMCYEVFLILLVLSVRIVWVGLFISGILKTA